MKDIEDVFEDKARAGDGQFAIAYALLMLAKTNEKVATKLGRLGFDGPGGEQGALEYIGTRMRDITAALECLNVNASVTGSLDVNS